MHLSDEDFLRVIYRTPLVSVDLILRSPSGEILLGRRKEEPAYGFWFVPGGRIKKNEKVDDAIIRIAERELGLQILANNTRFIGYFEHFYDSNRFKDPGVSTHYVVLGFEIDLSTPDVIKKSGLDEHSSFTWFSHESASERIAEIHPNTMAYFRDRSSASVPNNCDELQYEILCSRRDTYDELVWQTPVLSLTAQAFLLVIALGSDVTDAARRIAAVLSILVSLCSIHLLMKHRFYEHELAKQLEQMEIFRRWPRRNARFIPAKWPYNLAAHRLWFWLLLLFAAAATLAFFWPQLFRKAASG